MPEPRIFLLSGRSTQEIPLSWLHQRREETPEPHNAIEVAPGVRVALLGCGDHILPGYVTAWGARVAVWAEAAPEGSVTEWGVRYTHRSPLCPDGRVKTEGCLSEESARQIAAESHRADHSSDEIVVYRRTWTGPWTEAPETEADDG